MWTSILALVIGIGLVVFSAAHVGTEYGIFLDVVGILLVIGGTLAVAFIKFPATEVFRLARTSFSVMRNSSKNSQATAREIISLVRDTRGEVTALQARVNAIRDPFIREGVNLIIDRIDAADIESILKNRIKIRKESDESTSNMLKALAKYPPSFGIIGTVLGLISLMLQLGSAGGAEKMGPAMAIGLVATLYGLVLTNFILQPLAENLEFKSYLEVQRLQIIMVGILLLKAGKPVFLVQEAVNSFLPENLRIELTSPGDSGQQRSNAA